jgi:hypothetical protein
MAGAWRNRYLAPFYALAISFVLVLLLGFTLEPPEPPPQPKPEPKSSITFSGQDKFPVKSASVWLGDEKHTVRSLSELEELKTSEPVMVCAQLDKKKWEAIGAEDAGIVTCWGPLEPRRPGGVITLRVAPR